MNSKQLMNKVVSDLKNEDLELKDVFHFMLDAYEKQEEEIKQLRRELDSLKDSVYGDWF